MDTKQKQEKHPNFPYDEVAKTAKQAVADGAVVYQKWTCGGCGGRLTANNPNTFCPLLLCEECGHMTDVKTTGCNFLMILGVL